MEINNNFAIESDFIFDKCARNSGRVSSLLNLSILLMIGYFGLKQIYLQQNKKDVFRILITLFTVNHLTHFFYVFQKFKHHALQLNIADNKHGFFSFICIVALPIVLWIIEHFNKTLYIAIILHLFNTSYFIMETFYNKIKPDKPAYHNQLGILLTCIALFYILYKIYLENRRNKVEQQ